MNGARLGASRGCPFRLQTEIEDVNERSWLEKAIDPRWYGTRGMGSLDQVAAQRCAPQSASMATLPKVLNAR
jgi:hypothetical protein